MRENKSTEALVYQTPTTVMLICPYCDHENDYEYRRKTIETYNRYMMLNGKQIV